MMHNASSCCSILLSSIYCYNPLGCAGLTGETGLLGATGDTGIFLKFHSRPWRAKFPSSQTCCSCTPKIEFFLHTFPWLRTS